MQTNSAKYAFGRYVLDEEAHSVTTDGVTIRLTPKEFATLSVLLHAAGRPVGRDELTREVWPETHVGEGSLPRNISVLRRQLGEECVETIPKVGYRLALSVTRLQ